jgi:hypothetical protein
MRIQRLLLPALAVLLAVPVFAQRFTASIRGTVTDPSSAVISGAQVTIKNEETGLTRKIKTNAAGSYSVADLPVGSYSVEVEAAGFTNAVRAKIELNVAQVRDVDVQMQAGGVSETVNVVSDSGGVTTVGAEIAGLVTGEQARELPLNGRNFMQLTLLQPGVTPNEGLNTVNKGLQGGSDISVSGGSTTSNLWLIDGADNVDHGSNRTIMVYPSLDAIEEFKIQRNNYGAEFGQAGGAQVNLVTKGGTNTFHGSTYYFLRRDSLNATNYFLEQAGKDKAPLKWDDFGATLGGPIVKDKLNFFFSYENNKDQRSSIRSGQVPTALERTGDFSVRTPCSPPIPTDPLTGQPFPGGKIPANRLNPAGVAFLNLYQAPNNTPTTGCANFLDTAATPINWHQINARVDWNLSSSTRVMVRYTQDSWVANNLAGGVDGVWGDSQTSVVSSNWDQPGKSLVAQLNQSLGSTMSNTLTFSYSGNKINVTRDNGQSQVDTLNSLIPTLYPASIKERGGQGQPWWWGGAGYGDLWNQSPWTNNQDLYVLKDDWSSVFGKHFVKAGLFLSSSAKNEEPANTSQESVLLNGSAGFITPAGFQSGLNTGNAAADLLLNGTAFNTSELKTNKAVQQRWKDIEFYLADSYKLTPSVTADFGLRFSHMQPPFMKDDAMGNFVLASVDPALGNSPCNGMQYPPGTNPCPALGLAGGSDGPNRSLVPTQGLWVAPRLGIAWDVNGDGKTALRAGLGRFYQRDRVSPGLGVGQNPPFTGTSSIVRTLESADVVSGNAAPAFGAASNALDQIAANTNYWQWNVAFEREIFKGSRLEVAYVGSKGMDLYGQTNLNEVLPANRQLYATTNSAAYRPLNGIEGIGNGNVALWQHNRDSIYHALQTALVSRFGHGSQFSLAYTWSKAIANTGIGNADGPGLSNLNAYIDSTNPQLDRARGANDATHVFSGNLILALPKLENSSSFAKTVFGDWQLNTIVQASTGYPITVITGNVNGLPGGGGPSGAGNGITLPNRVQGVDCHANAGNNSVQWLNPAAWTLNGFVIGGNGNASRNTCDGPGLFETDASVYKNFTLSNRVKLQLRVEMYNVFNTVNFLGTSLTNGGTLHQYNANNVVLSADKTTIISADPNQSFGQITASRDPRTMQMGVRLIF